MKTVTITWGGDRIELGRDDLTFNAETDPRTTTTIRVTVDKGDNNAAIPTTDLTVDATGMTAGFSQVRWGTVDVTAAQPACSSADFTGLSAESGTLTLPTAAPKSDGVCFRITDTDSDTTDEDTNATNVRDYMLIVTRK